MKISKKDTYNTLKTLKIARHIFCNTSMLDKYFQVMGMKRYILIILFLVISTSVYAQVTAIMEPDWTHYDRDSLQGNGYFNDPYIFRSDKVKLKCTIKGTDMKNCTYYPQIHMDGFRNCTTVWPYPITATRGWSIDQTNGYTFYFDPSLPGKFYLRIDIWYPGGSYFTESWTSWVHILFKTPPVNDWNESTPYLQPPGNVAPVVTFVPINCYAGSGSFNNPWLLHEDSTHIEFRIDATDANGANDILFGGFHWAMMTYPGHFYHTAGGQQLTEEQTFLFRDDIYNVNWRQNVDVYRPENGYLIHPSSTATDTVVRCNIGLEGYDQHGEFYNNGELYWSWGSDNLEPPPPDSLPDPPDSSDVAWLVFNPDSVFFYDKIDTAYWYVGNMGDLTLNWTSAATIPWLLPNKGSGSLERLEIDTVMAICFRDSVSIEGIYEDSVQFTGDGNTRYMYVMMEYDDTPEAPTNLRITPLP